MIIIYNIIIACTIDHSYTGVVVVFQVHLPQHVLHSKAGKRLKTQQRKLEQSKPIYVKSYEDESWHKLIYFCRSTHYLIILNICWAMSWHCALAKWCVYRANLIWDTNDITCYLNCTCLSLLVSGMYKSY